MPPSTISKSGIASQPSWGGAAPAATDSSPSAPSAASRNSRRRRAKRLKRRSSTSAIDAKSFAPATDLMRKRRYSRLAGWPSWKTTMLATEFVPWMLEMS